MTSEPNVLYTSVPVAGSSDPPLAVTFVLVDCPGNAIFHQRAGTGLLKGLTSSEPLAVAVCFDIGRRESLQTAAKLLKSIGITQGNTVGVLLGCKSDYRGEGGWRSECSFSDGTTTASQLGLKYFECSSLTGEGVMDPFAWIAGELTPS
jgi:hypothetical protein